jgi:hypothetical protein
MNARRTIYQRKVKLNVSRLTEPGNGTQNAGAVTPGEALLPLHAASV